MVNPPPPSRESLKAMLEIFGQVEKGCRRYFILNHIEMLTKWNT